MKLKTYIASEWGAVLDSNVQTGGGTDDTSALQTILDLAKDKTQGVRLIVDGAALIHGLKVYSNTIIECPSAACGFYLADHSDCPVIENGNPRPNGEPVDENITLIGGTYNQNCPHQLHDIPHNDNSGFYPSWGLPGFAPSCDLVVNHQWVGVRRLTVRDIIITDQRTYAMILCNWEHVTIENVEVVLPNRVHGQNQDGFHVFGPGRFLTMRNVGGRTSDDFIALAPDERDGESTITDVLIDGVHLDDADQAIRMLCHKNGFLDRVVIRNVTGTYRSFGFFMNPFFPSGVGEKAGYGNITIDTVDLRSNGIDYDYTAPFLFRVGGRADNLTFRNITHYCPQDDRPILDIGPQYYEDSVPVTPGNETRIFNITLENVTVIRKNGSAQGDIIRVGNCLLQNLLVQNVNVIEQAAPAGHLLHIKEGAKINRLQVKDICGGGLAGLLRQEGGTIDTLILPSLQENS